MVEQKKLKDEVVSMSGSMNSGGQSQISKTTGSTTKQKASEITDRKKVKVLK